MLLLFVDVGVVLAVPAASCGGCCGWGVDAAATTLGDDSGGLEFAQSFSCTRRTWVDGLQQCCCCFEEEICFVDGAFLIESVADAIAAPFVLVVCTNSMCFPFGLEEDVLEFSLLSLGGTCCCCCARDDEGDGKGLVGDAAVGCKAAEDLDDDTTGDLALDGIDSPEDESFCCC